MFSGIVEEAALVVKLVKEQENLHITMECSFVNELKIDQSISHNGVCLTVVKKEGKAYKVTAMPTFIVIQNGNPVMGLKGANPKALTELVAKY